jgi:sugar O-acyltransferase (sialic acid O-acetyltransferase NeuD family)
MKEKIYIVGAGTYGEAMCELANILGYNVEGFYDDDYEKHGKLLMGVKIIDSFNNLKNEDFLDKNFIVAVGNNKIRQNMCCKINKNGGHTPSLIHPTAVISPSAEIGNGVYIQAMAYIWTNVKINDYCIISPNVVIAHHSNIGEACLISTGTVVGASIKIKEKSFLGIGTIIVTGISEIGENSLIGAGAVVLKNVAPNSVMVGNPARYLRENK